MNFTYSIVECGHLKDKVKVVRDQDNRTMKVFEGVDRFQKAEHYIRWEC